MTLAAVLTALVLFGPSWGSVPIAVYLPFGQTSGSTPSQSQQEPASAPQPETSPPEPAKPDQQAKPDSPEPQSPSGTAAPSQNPPTDQPPAQAAPPAKTVTKKHRKKKTTPPAAEPAKVVVRNGSTTEPSAQIAPGGVSKERANSELKITNQLLAHASVNLEKLSTHKLSAAQEDMVKQIRTYMDQAKSASDSGDWQRAHNLASKAQMLSDDLLRH